MKVLNQKKGDAEEEGKNEAPAEKKEETSANTEKKPEETNEIDVSTINE